MNSVDELFFQLEIICMNFIFLHSTLDIFAVAKYVPAELRTQKKFPRPEKWNAQQTLFSRLRSEARKRGEKNYLRASCEFKKCFIEVDHEIFIKVSAGKKKPKTMKLMTMTIYFWQQKKHWRNFCQHFDFIWELAAFPFPFVKSSSRCLRGSSQSKPANDD